MIGYIYLIIDHYKNKVYIGQRTKLDTNDELNYFGSGKWIKSIIKKRKHHLQKIILGYCNSKEELNEAEKICIEHFQSNDKRYGYNITSGGDGVIFKRTNEHNKKISDSLKGRKLSNEHKRKISIIQKGKRFEERFGVEKAKIIKLKISVKLTGKSKSSEHIKKVNDALRGKKLSKNHCNKISLALVGKKQSKETKIKKSLSTRKIYKTKEEIIEMLNNGFTLKEISCIFNCHERTVIDRLKGKEYLYENSKNSSTSY